MPPVVQDKCFGEKLGRLYGEIIDEIDDESEPSNCKWNNQNKNSSAFWLNFYLKISSVKLGCPPENSPLANHWSVDEEHLKNVLKPEDSAGEPPAVLANSWLASSLWRSRFVRPVCWTLLIYAVLKYMTMTKLRWDHDTALKQWNPMVRATANHTDTCALPQDISSLEPEHEKRFRETHYWLDLFGDPLISVKGGPIIAYYLCFGLTLSIYLGGMLFMFLYEVRADFLGFLLHPVGERLRIRRLVNAMILELIDSLDHHARVQNALDLIGDDDNRVNSINELPGSQTGSRHHQQQIERLFLVGSPSARRKSTPISSKFSHSLSRRSEYLMLISILDLIRECKLVKPANLSFEWHRKLLTSKVYFMHGWNIYNSCFWLTTWSLCVLLELCLRSTRRLDLVQCHKWMENATIIKNNIPLLDLGADQAGAEARRAYENHNGSLVNLIYLAISIESRYYFGLKSCLALAEVCLIELFASIFFPLYVSLFWSGLVDKMRWLDQIWHQLTCCVGLFMQRNESIKPTTGRNDHDDDHGNKANKHRNELKSNDNSQDRLLRVALIAYLNYTLFKSQYYKFQFTSNFFIGQIFVLIGTLLVTSYMVATSIESTVGFAQWHLVGMTYIIMFINFYLLGCSLMLSKVRKIMHQINRLLALNSGNSSNMAFLMELWRRQLLDGDELTRTYAFSFFGNYIGTDKIVAFNVYLVTLWIKLIATWNR